MCAVVQVLNYCPSCTVSSQYLCCCRGVCIATARFSCEMHLAFQHHRPLLGFTAPLNRQSVLSKILSFKKRFFYMSASTSDVYNTQDNRITSVTVGKER